MKTSDRARLEEKLGHSFANPDLLARALTHASAVAGSSGTEPESYQRLEFLGDRVLGLAIADALVERFPDAAEGELSRRLARLVSRETCTEVAQEMALAEHLRMGGSVKKGGAGVTPGVLADVCEAVIAAVYRDGGLEAARKLVERYWGGRVQSMRGPLRDAKTELQEWAHRRGLEAPSYVETLRTGPDHRPEFEIEVSVGGVPPERARGGSKREAEHEAAASLLRREGVWHKT
jgi:ribonuclease III